MRHTVHTLLSLSFILSSMSMLAHAQSRQAPPGMFKDLDDEILGEARIIHGTQLFIDDVLVDDMQNVQKQLNQPVKYENNPVLVRDMPWEDAGPGFTTILFDPVQKTFQMFYEVYAHASDDDTSYLHYATSKNGIDWEKELVSEDGTTNRIRQPKEYGFVASGIFRDPVERDPAKRYKMIFSCKPDRQSKSLRTSVAFSPDGIEWSAYPETALIPFSDSQNCPLWDAKSGRYVAYLRYGPPNTRIVSRIESEDFVHWSNKITVLPSTKMDGPLATQFYYMTPFAYRDIYMGLICAYHTESLKPITDDAPWTDRKNLHLAYSRNGVTWSRVGKTGAIPAREMNDDKDWKQIALDAVFLPYGEKDKEWDWGTISPVFIPEPIIVNDEIWFYYSGIDAKNWWNWFGDPPQLDPKPKEPNKGIGLAKLRLDGFVSVNAGDEAGTLTTKPLVFFGDTLELNADTDGGSLTVEALDAESNTIEGFSQADADPITSDNIRHVASWNGNADCHLLQGRPIRLRFHLQHAKLYSFTPRIRINHYLQSYE